MANDLSYYLAKQPLVNNDIRYMPDEVKTQVKLLVPGCTGELRECFYWLEHKLTEYPTCPTCQGKLSSKSFLNGVKGYRTYCSKSCMRTSEQYKQSYKQTCLDKYGAEHSFSSKVVQEKRQDTNLLRYGDKNPAKWSSELFKARMMTKYGATNPLLVPSIRDQVSESLRHGYIETGKLDERLHEIEESEAVVLDGSYIGFDSMMTWKHKPCGELFLSNLADGKIPSCPKCNAKSKPEYELFKAVEAFVGEGKAIRNDRTAIKPFELDVFVPHLNVAFEMNGLYYHSELFLKERAKTYHTYKQELCEAAGIKLIQFFDEEWHTKRTLLLDKIENVVGKSKRKYARDLLVYQVNAETKNAFLTKNHLQGKDVSKVAMALVDEAGIVYSMMTFCKSRFSKQHEWELSRFTNDRGMTVVGGASRLLKAFIKAYAPKSIITYADARFSGGKLYNALGFQALRRSPPNYWYVKGDNKLSRYQAQKHLLPALLGSSFNPSLTEVANMHANKWYRVYDCGNYVFELQLKSS